MRISHVTVKGFRSLRDVDLELPQGCALVGPNNAGKSNLLEAIRRVMGRDWVSSSSFVEDDVYLREPSTDIEIALKFDPAIAFNKVKGAPPSDVFGVTFKWTRYKIGSRKGERRLEQDCIDRKGGAVMVVGKPPRKGEQHKYEPVVGIPSDVRDAVPLIYIGTNRSLKEHLPGARYSLLRPLLEDIDRGLRDPKNTITSAGPGGGQVEMPRLERFQELMGEALKVLRTTDLVALEKAIKDNALHQLGFDPSTDSEKLDFFFSPFDSMDFYKSLDLRVREGGFSISATELGEGVQNALVLAILRAFEQRRRQGAIILIEEPEMFLHPQMQRSLYRTLREIGRTNQVIYTTHSTHFVAVPDYTDVVILRRGPAGTLATPSALPSDPKRREKLLKELDPERNELFFASRVLFVEGDTEKLALPEYARRLGVDLDRDGATIVEVGGKRNLPEFIAITSSFGIPVGAVFDSDSTDFKDDRDSERTFNASLKALEKSDGSLKVWELSRNFEDHLRGVLGERAYQAECQKYPNIGKPTRARLMAADLSLAIPDPFPRVLQWLAGRPAQAPVVESK
ncbi:MAG TPA: AAA family ATPase [Candidatus Eisenbacteria bacterium]|jgi:predicted ATPase